MKALALVLALVGCDAIQQHPFTTTAIANVAITTTAGVCTFECRGGAQDLSEGVFIGELALSSIIAAWWVEWLVGESTR